MDSRISKRPVVVCAVIALVAALAGATTGSSAPTTSPPPSPIKALVNSLKGKSNAAREARLLELAKGEGGTLNWYTSLSSLVVKEVQKGFEAQYPGIKINLFRGSSESVTARISQEAQADKSGADIVETNGTNMLFFQHKKNVIIPYAGSPYRAAIPKQYRFDTWTADRLEEFVVAWNTNLVSGSDVPRNWSDLTSAKWKGKLAMEPTDVDWYAALWTYLRKHGNKGKPLAASRVDALFRNIARNAQMIGGHTTEATLLAAGQVAIVVTGHAQSLEQLQAKGAPIAFRPFVKPVIQRPQGVGVVYRLSHPATALLFYDWLLSPKGQAILLKNGVEPARPDFTDSSLRGAPRIEMDLRPIVAHYQAWSDRYDAIVRLGKGG